jgi:hypothetical protein
MNNSTINVIGFFRVANIHTLDYIKSLSAKINFNLKFIFVFDDDCQNQILGKAQNITIVNKITLIMAVSSYYNLDPLFLNSSAENYKPLYKILLGIYCRKNFEIDYCLMTDDDIYIYREVPEINKCLLNVKQFFIQESNQAFEIPDLVSFIIDKFNLSIDIKKPLKGNGLNVGFCGLNLKVYDYFSNENFNEFLKIFNNIHVWWKEQSFIILMAHSLNEEVEHFDEYKYFFYSHDDYRYYFKSNIYHCINTNDKSKISQLYKNNGPKFWDIVVELIYISIKKIIIKVSHYKS